jgi:hypothetical protein
MELANAELIDNGDPHHVWVEILLTDANAGDHDLIKEQADIAANNSIMIFPIGLNVNNPSNIDLMNYVANTTGGKYFPAPNASAITEIFSQIFLLVGGIAGFKPNPGVEETMIKFVLDDGIDYIDGTFELVPGTFETDPNPDEVTITPTKTILEWYWVNDRILIGKLWGVSFSVSSEKIGKNVPVNIESESIMVYKTLGGILIIKPFPLLTIEVLPMPTTTPYITNITTEPQGVNITWDPVSNAEYYEIYGGTDQTSLNLDSADVLDTVLAPQTWWIDIDNLPLYSEYYYVVRAVDTDMNPYTTSSTSNTGGYYKRDFISGLNTFSLPLEPFGDYDTEWYTLNMNADYIRYMDPSTSTWITHNKSDGNFNNIQLNLGEGYEVKFTDPTTYVFTGMPAAMISHTQGPFVGFDFKSNAGLSASVNPDGDVTLTWEGLTNMDTDDVYRIYRSTTRDGFHTGSANLAATLTYGLESWVDFGIAQSNTQFYYMVVPENETGTAGASTYSIGVWTQEYILGYDTFGFPLKLDNYPAADWFCDNIPNTIGINYFINSQQRWSWHSTEMTEGAFDPILEFGLGYQISTAAIARYTFVGV